jgi:N-acetylmuramate 1-kinase
MDTDGMDLGPALARLYGTPTPEGAVLRRLMGDASTRSYYRLTVPAPPPGAPASAIIMRLPSDALRSDEAAGDGPVDELPFLAVHRLLSERGLPVPEVWVDDVPRGLLVLEDLGDQTFERRLLASPRTQWAELYGQAIDLLADMHQRCEAPTPGSLAHGRRFEPSLLRWELDHFREWGLEAVHGPLPLEEAQPMGRAFDALTAAVAALPQGFVHRDYQSRNLMWRPRDGSLTVIDFQDALMGPQCYDLVALLCDSYVSLDEALQVGMIERYALRRGLDAAALETAFWLMTVQRKLKDAGRFVFIDRVRGNASFLRWYGPSLVYVARALERLAARPERTAVAGLNEVLQRRLPGYPDRVAAPPSASGDA